MEHTHMNKEQAYNSFFNRFGVFAFEENAVPTDDVIAQLINAGSIKSKYPYITYQVLLDDLNAPVYPVFSIWDNSTSWERADLLSNAISEYLQDGIIIRLDNGRMFITKGSPFAQHQREEGDSNIRRVLCNLGIEFFTKY